METLDSVFAQTFTDYEVIVVNDGSPDDTAEVLRPLAEAGRIRYFGQRNQGQAAARNRGLAEARGEFIALLDDDDRWPPGKLEWQAAVLREAKEAGVVCGQKCYLGDSHFEPVAAPSEPLLEAFLTRNRIQSPGQTLIRASILKQIGGFDPDIWGADDWDLWLRLAAATEFAFREEPALIHRRHAGNASRHFLRMHANAHKVLRNHLGSFPREHSRRLWLNARFFVNDFTSGEGFEAASKFLLAGEPLSSLRALAGVARIRPRLLLSAKYLRAAGSAIAQVFSAAHASR